METPTTLAQAAVNAGLGKTECLAYLNPDGSTASGVTRISGQITLSAPAVSGGGTAETRALAMNARYGIGFGMPFLPANAPAPSLEFNDAGNLDELKWCTPGMIFKGPEGGGWFTKSGLGLPYTIHA